MFWLRNKKIKFLLRTLNSNPGYRGEETVNLILVQGQVNDHDVLFVFV